MLLHIPSVLTADQVAQCREALAGADWVDGKATAGIVATKAKNNMQVSVTEPAAQKLREMILHALQNNVLFLSADNFQTSEHFDATYGGWGWQAWGGVSVPLSGNSRITAEVFRNQSEVGRDVDDPQTGVTYREIVNLDGVGMRFGLGWGF